MQFLRSIQLDESDRKLFQHPARSGEWAVPGGFAWLDSEAGMQDPAAREAFRHAFVGTESFGHTSLVIVADIAPAALAAVIERLTAHFRERYDAPSDAAARSAAEEEVGFTLEISVHPPGTLISVQRQFCSDGVEETYKTVSPPHGVDHSRVRLWGADKDP